MKNQTVKKLFAIGFAATLAGSSVVGCGNVANVETDAPVKQEASATTPEEKPEKKEPVIAKTVKASEEDVKAFVEHDVFEGIEDADVTEGTDKDLMDTVKVHNKDLVKDIKVKDKANYDKAGSYDAIFTIQFDKKELVKFIEENDLDLSFEIDEDADIIQVEVKVTVKVSEKTSAKKPAALVINTTSNKGDVMASTKPVVKPAVNPVTPSNPVKPNKPVTPDKPVKPVHPDKPVNPVVPDKPVKPEKPDVPWTPIEPSTPVEPEKPDIPLTPLEPSTPVEPEKPDIPLTPIEPSTPVEPEKPDIPLTPLEPSKPIEKPDIPLTPIEPSKPIEKPDIPLTPIEPSKPIEKPDIPLTPIEPSKPIEKPDIPLTPIEPSKPIEHIHSWKPVYKTIVIKPAWDEQLYKKTSHAICNQCGKDFGPGLEGEEAAGNHIIDSGLSGGHCIGYHIETVKVPNGVEHHPAITKDVLDHWVCDKCGETKPADVEKPDIPLTPIEPSKPIEKPDIPLTPIEPSKPIEHIHNWKPVYKTELISPEEGHYETVVIEPEEGHFETVIVTPEEGHYETVVIEPEQGHHETVVIEPEEGHFETITIPEEGHFETIVIKPAWDEQLYKDEVHAICNQCGKDFGPGLEGAEAAGNHIIDSGLSGGHCIGYHSEEVKVPNGVEHHPAITDEKWIVDKEAVTEKKWIVDKEAVTEQKWVVDKEAVTEQKWIVDKEAVTDEKWIVDKEAVTDKKWVVDKEAVTKEYLDHWICEECGETKPADESDSTN